MLLTGWFELVKLRNMTDSVAQTMLTTSSHLLPPPTNSLLTTVCSTYPTAAPPTFSIIFKFYINHQYKI